MSAKSFTKPPDSAGYSESFNSTKNESREEEVIFTRAAEDEVVALILATIMGSIVKSWEIPTTTRDSDLCSACVLIEKNKYDAFCTHSESMTKEKSTDLRQLSSSFTQLSEQFFSEKKSKSQNSTISKKFITSIESANQLAENTSRGRSSQFGNEEGDLPRSLQSLNTVDANQKAKKHVSFMSMFENEKDKIYGWSFLEVDSEVIIQFKQGNCFEGKLVSCRMHDRGKFYWADGSAYEGDFQNGQMTGDGCLEWPDQSWYEGELLQGYRHGQGIYVQYPKFYCGRWECGQQNGSGCIYYDRISANHHYYEGEWANDCKQGWGMCTYPSGAKYSGQWYGNLRHGLGTVVWSNNDVYSGNWENGLMNGYGEYTWATFFNNQLVVPQENCFYGNWENGVRNGNGTLETSLGVTVRGTWVNGKKHGPAEVICRNGTFVYADDLFTEDCISKAIQTSTVTVRGDSNLDKTFHASNHLYKVPVTAPNHKIELSFYIDRLSGHSSRCKRVNRTFSKGASMNWTPTRYDSRKLTRSSVMSEKLDEESLLRNIIMQYLSLLKMIYIRYSELCCKKKPDFNSVLMRLMLWQLFRDCNLHKKGFPLAHFDILIANNRATLVQGVHYPFERLQFWQFLHCLIEMSWELYGKHKSGTPSVQGVLASAFHKLLTVDILPNAGKTQGNVLMRYKNFLSLDSLYWFYRGLGEPLSARKLLKNIFTPAKSYYQHRPPNYPGHLLHGENMIGVGGKLSYFTADQPYYVQQAKQTADFSEPQDLTRLSSVGLETVFNCLLETCPSIAINDVIVNMDYKLIFLEFYEILLLCANLCVEKKIQDNITNGSEPVKDFSQEKEETNDTVLNAEEVEELTEEKRKSKPSSLTKKKTKNKKKK